MEIPHGQVLTAFMKFLELDLDLVGENLRRVKPSLNLASEKAKWRRWQIGEAYPERSSFPLVFAGLGLYRIENFKIRWEQFKRTPEGQAALRKEEESFAEELRWQQVSEIAEFLKPFDAIWEKARRRSVTELVNHRIADLGDGISAGKAQAADSLRPQLLRNAEIVDDQIEILEALYKKAEILQSPASS